MLSLKQMVSLTRRWRHYFESIVYVECLAHSMKKTPTLEFSDDRAAYTNGDKIHIGVGMLEAEDDTDLFNQIHYLIGHELQHLLSTTDKDWEAAHKLCFRSACQRISVSAFGKARRLTKDSDYENFFKDLAERGIFVNQDLIMTYANFVLNTLEDGRIENIRPRIHPGFGNYRKIFRAERWLKDDFRDETFYKKDPSDLTAIDELKTLLGQIYYLATLGIYQKGFLETCEGAAVHSEVQNFIPEISRAVLGRTCKVCMDQGRIIFDRLLDRIIDVCTLEADAMEIQKFLEELLKKMLDEASNQKLSATPNSEEKGDGLPAESIFGQTELVIELDEEEYEKLMENAEETDDASGVRIKVKKKGGETSDEEDLEDGSNGSGSSGAEEKSEGESDDGSAAEAADNSCDGSEDEDIKSSAISNDENEEASSSEDEYADSESLDQAGEAIDTSSDVTEDGNQNSSGDSGQPTEESSSINNRVDEAKDSSVKSPEDFERDIRDAMEKAAEKATADFNLAEADAKLDEKFSDAAASFNAVDPEEVDLSEVDSKYDCDISFIESVRTYTPIGRLPLELENKGKSLDHKIEELVRNKQDPDQRYLKSGMLDTRRLASFAMGDLSVFKKKGEPSKTDVAAFLLMDNSGSMGNGPGSTRFACCNAFAVLEEGFKKHMPLKIAAFDARGVDEVSHEVIKEFDEVSEPNLSFNFRDLGRDGWGNKDGYSIRVATKQLQNRPEKDKILIIASDGFPTEYRGGEKEGCADVKEAVLEARRAGIRTIGMYMFHEQSERDFAVFQDMYGPEIIFASLDEIEDELTRVLKRYF